MPRTAIDAAVYALSDVAKEQLNGLHAVDRRIDVLEAELALLKTARNAYGCALVEVLVAKA
jgi:hypothetical protein